jgi:hypothetical protein
LGLNLLGQSGSRYDELVESVQSHLRLLESAFKLRFDLKDSKVIFVTCQAKLKPKDFFCLSFVRVLPQTQFRRQWLPDFRPRGKKAG